MRWKPVPGTPFWGLVEDYKKNRGRLLRAFAFVAVTVLLAAAAINYGKDLMQNIARPTLERVRTVEKYVIAPAEIITKDGRQYLQWQLQGREYLRDLGEAPTPAPVPTPKVQGVSKAPAPPTMLPDTHTNVFLDPKTLEFRDYGNYPQMVSEAITIALLARLLMAAPFLIGVALALLWLANSLVMAALYLVWFAFAWAASRLRQLGT